MKIIACRKSTSLFQLINSRIPAGFSSPAEDYKQDTLSLDDLIIQNPLSTFFAEIEGDSMLEANITEGDIAVIDKSLTPKNNDHVLAWVESKGGFTIKRYEKKGNKIYLCPANNKYSRIELTEDQNARLWGVVVAYIRKMK